MLVLGRPLYRRRRRPLLSKCRPCINLSTPNRRGKKGTAWRRRCCQFAETGRYTVGTVATCSTIRRCLPNWLHPRRTVSMLHTFCRSRNGKSGAQSKRLSRNWKELRYSVRQVCNLVSTVKPPAVSGPPTYIVGGYWMETGIPDHDTLLAPRPCFVFFFVVFVVVVVVFAPTGRNPSHGSNHFLGGTLSCHGLFASPARLPPRVVPKP